MLACALALSPLAASYVQAQTTVVASDDQFVREKDKDTHNKWRKGKSPFPARPRDMWQIGLGGGSFIVGADVKPQFGWGASLHARKSLGYTMSLRLEGLYANARGLSYSPTTLRGFPQVSPFTLTNERGDITNADLYDDNDVFYSNYRSEVMAFSAQALINLNNIKFHKPANKWSLNWIIGVGAAAYHTRYDALDGNGNAYDFRTVGDGLDMTKLADRRTLRDNVKGILDDEYETPAQNNGRNAVTFGSDEKKYTLLPYLNTGLSLEFLVTNRLSIAVEHQVFFNADDYIDGKARSNSGSSTSGIDLPHYTSLRLGFHLGKKTKRTPPLWFINPLNDPYKDLEALKSKDEDLLKDDDDDGVPNRLDKEPDTEPGAVVDTKGRTKDSDGDKVPDHKDEEPFSSPGYPTDDRGVAMVPKAIYPEDVKVDGNKLIIGKEVYEPKGGAGGGLDGWFLPTIHFNSAQYTLRPESYTNLKHIADVMTQYPNIKVVVYGHTDSRASDEYNDMLSYNRAMAAIDFLRQEYNIDINRFIVQYNGKRKSLVAGAKKDEEHFMNRRVEFRVARPEDKSQARPAEPKDRKQTWKY